MIVSILGVGWLGLPLAIFLSQSGFSVKGSTTSIAKFGDMTASDIVPYQISLTSSSCDIPSEFLESECLIVTLPFKRSYADPRDYFRIIQQVLARVPDSVSTLIFTSSTAAYPNTNGVVKEDTPIESTVSLPLRASLLMETERLFLNLSSPNRSAYVLRLAGLIGPNREPGRFLAHQTHVPNGAAPINLVHLEDCISVITQLLRQRPDSGVYNVVADEHPLKHEYYTQKALDLGITPPTFDMGQAEYKWVSNAKVKSTLGITFRPLV